MKLIIVMFCIFSFSIYAQVNDDNKNEEKKGSTTIVIDTNQGKAIDTQSQDNNVTKVSGGVEQKYELSGIPVTFGGKATILSNQGNSKDHITAEAEGHIRYPLVTRGHGDNFRVILDLGYNMGYDKFIGFKSTLGTGLTMAVCSNQKEGEVKEWRLCWLNSAKGQMMVERAVWLEASTAIEVQKKINDSLRIRGGAKMIASDVHDTEKNKHQSAISVVATIGIDWDYIPKKVKSSSTSK